MIVLIHCNTCCKNVNRVMPGIFCVHVFVLLSGVVRPVFSVSLQRAIQENNVCVLVHCC